MDADKESTIDDKIVDAFVVIVSYAILSLGFILLASEIWYWGNATHAEVSNGMRSAIWVVLVRLGIYSAWKFFYPRGWRHVRQGYVVILATVGSGTLLLALLRWISGTAVAPGIGILLLDSVFHFVLLALVGAFYSWRRGQPDV